MMSETLEAIALSLLRKGKKVTAVKVVRNRTGWELKEAKDFVDNLESGHQRPRPTISEIELTGKARRILQSQGKIEAIKQVRASAGWGLKQAKDFVDNL